jgi:paraquat-inducible protein B
VTEPNIAEAAIERPRGGGGFAVAWAIPLIALLIAGTMVWRHYASLGPEIRIALDSGAGIEPGQTVIRYRDVEVGRVEALTFSDDLSTVIARAQMSADIAGRITDAATFWVVRPEISGTNVSGLETLLSGAYLGVDWGKEAGAPASEFTALAAPPLTPPGTPGRRVRLVSRTGSALGPGAPVFFKSIEVGRVETKELAPGGSRVDFGVFVKAPYHELLNDRTRFWNASGVSLDVNAAGVSLSVESLASLVRGGVVFDSVADGGGARDAASQDEFRLFANESAARDSVFAENPSSQVRFSVSFGRSVRGLRAGAPVEYRGVEVGEVEDLTIRAGETLDEIEIVATLLVQPRRIGFEGSGAADNIAFFRRSVARGLRVRLSSASIVTGALYVELVDVPDAPPAELDMTASPYPRLPAVPSTLDALQVSAQNLIERLNALPIEEVLRRTIGVLENIENLTGDPGLVKAPGDIAAILGSAQAVLSEIERAGVASDLTATLESTRAAAAAFETAAQSLPALARRLEAAAAQGEAAMKALGEGSALNTEALAALREMRQAAKSVSSLAQALERRPNSLILGR